MHDTNGRTLLARTERFAQFLRAAVAVRHKTIREVEKYPTVLWFSDLPTGVPAVRSPLLAKGWDADDVRWLVVSRPTEPVALEAPSDCRSFLDGVDLANPTAMPDLAARTEQGPEGQAIVVEPPGEVVEQWVRWQEDMWTPWAERVRIARLIKPVYQGLFKAYQELQGRDDAYDVFIGVGLLHAMPRDDGSIRRHLLAFPAELTFDSQTGTLAIQPAADFEQARIEVEFLTSDGRAILQKRRSEIDSDLADIGPSLDRRIELGRVVTGLVHALEAEADYIDALEPQGAAPFKVRASFAPAFIVRPRTMRSLDELLRRIEEDSRGETAKISPTQLTGPWRRLVEDENSWENSGLEEGERRRQTTPEIPHFPLPSNEEQSKIIKHASGTAGVVVQGPPGTGKSHTIANLISHYLATGRRVLVTAEKAQALQVLKDKLPTDLRALCVSLLGVSSASDKDLERSVKGILGKHQDTDDPAAFSERAVALERELEQAEVRLATFDRELYDARLAETVPQSPVPGYAGTRATIARKLSAERDSLGWIADDIPVGARCPDYRPGSSALAAYHSSLDDATRRTLKWRWVPLPFEAGLATAAMDEISAARAALAANQTSAAITPDTLSQADADVLATWLGELQHHGMPPAASDAGWMGNLRQCVLRQEMMRWEILHGEAADAASRCTDAIVADTIPVDMQGERMQAQARRDITRLAEHYASGGRRRRLLIFKPRVVRETEWIERHVAVEGYSLTTREGVERARRALDGWAALNGAWRAWGEWTLDRAGSPKQQIASLRHRQRVLANHLDLAKKLASHPPHVRAWMASEANGTFTTPELLYACRRHVNAHRLTAALRRRDNLVSQLESSVSIAESVPTLGRLRDGLVAEDRSGVADALEEHEFERVRHEHHAVYLRFCSEVQSVAPRLAARIRECEGSTQFASDFLHFEEAWAHRRAAGWLSTVMSGERVEAAERASRDERSRIQELKAEITAAKAWYHALSRIDDRKRGALVGWTTAVAKIPKTGPSVFRKRAVARAFLNRCLDTIPAWVVSLNRLYETVEARPGLFDIAIVDEASQCWLDSLILFYLAKQVIIVGDDKQISPTVVGVKDGEVERLANAYLPDLSDRGLLTIDSSLFEHARRYLSASVPLREHFRSVPEIIRFSNELCYVENKLIPLRPTSRDRLEPLKAVFVEDGLRNGDVNEAEARAIVEQIVRCHDDAAYEDADFGVICLQGEDQASRIQQLLLERLGPTVFEQRRLRCGNPYAFQGDERDVIFLSMVAASNTQNTALTRGIYEQRFNVAMSRARDQAWLFHSMRGHDFAPACLRRRVIEFFHQPLDQLIGGVSVDLPKLRLIASRADRTIERPPVPFDSWFELDVALTLSARGYQLSAQVQVAKRRIDLVIESDGGRLAVECDGEVWHGPERYADDLFRQRQLERAGWRFARVREGLFYSDEARALADVFGACEELEIGPGFQTFEPQREAAALRPETSSGLDTDMDAASARESLGDNDVSSEPFELGIERSLTRPVQATLDLPPAATASGPPYFGYDSKEYPDPRVAPPANVRDGVLDILERDGPLSKASIYRLYRDGCPKVERAGKHLRQAVNRALGILERGGKIESRDEGGQKAPEDVIVRLIGEPWVRIRPAGVGAPLRK